MSFKVSKYKRLEKQYKIIGYLLEHPIDDEDKAFLQQMWVAVTAQMIKMQGPEAVKLAIYRIEEIRRLNATAG